LQNSDHLTNLTSLRASFCDHIAVLASDPVFAERLQGWFETRDLPQKYEELRGKSLSFQEELSRRQRLQDEIRREERHRLRRVLKGEGETIVEASVYFAHVVLKDLLGVNPGKVLPFMRRILKAAEKRNQTEILQEPGLVSDKYEETLEEIMRIGGKIRQRVSFENDCIHSFAKNLANSKLTPVFDLVFPKNKIESTTRTGKIKAGNITHKRNLLGKKGKDDLTPVTETNGVRNIQVKIILPDGGYLPEDFRTEDLRMRHQQNQQHLIAQELRHVGDVLKNNPTTMNSWRLKHPEAYGATHRIKAGDYRILADINYDSQEGIIEVRMIGVGHRINRMKNSGYVNKRLW